MALLLALKAPVTTKVGERSGSLSGRVLDSNQEAAGSSLIGITELWSLSKTHLF